MLYLQEESMSRVSELTTLRTRRLSEHLHEGIAGYLLSLPAVVTLVVFLVLPILSALVLIFFDYGILSPPEFAGFDNILRLFKDKRLWTAFRNSLVMSIGCVAGNNLMGLLLAMGVNRKMPKVLQYIFRTTLFFPVITTTASLAMVWRLILTQDRGVMNWLLETIGLSPVPWLSHPQWAMGSAIMFDIWKACGFYMVIYLAGLQGIPEPLYEAAKIDGASRWQLTRHITLPLITPTAFFCIIISSIGAIQIFDNAYVLTQGGPGDATRTIAMYIYEVGFKRFEMGYAAAVSTLLLIILVILTLLQFRGGSRWVHYD
jgi:multiple sugar transport system permease protein